MKDQKKLMFAVAVAVIVIVGGVLIAGGSKSDTKSSSSSSSTPASKAQKVDTSTAVATNSVEISNYLFMPAVIKVKVGDTVTWTNQDAVRHNIVADEPSADAPNGPLISRGETFSYTFKKAGIYNYHCAPHPYMKGTVVVE
ncbi:MAG: cupredoxin family copper-binding protein [Candidatus Saccharimonadales bacterium]